jgi:hypothetical protein
VVTVLSSGCFVRGGPDLFLLVAVAAIVTAVIVSATEPPPPRVIYVPEERPGYAWQSGYWTLQNGQWVWIDGGWVVLHPGYAGPRPIGSTPLTEPGGSCRGIGCPWRLPRRSLPRSPGVDPVVGPVGRARRFDRCAPSLSRGVDRSRPVVVESVGRVACHAGGAVLR